MGHAGTVTHRCTCSSPLLCRTTFDSWEPSVHLRPITEDIMETNLAHGVGVKPVEILHDVGHLPLQYELTTLLEVQTGSIDDGKQHAIETGFVNVYGGGLNTRGSLDATAHKAVERGALFGGGGGGDVRSVEQKA